MIDYLSEIPLPGRTLSSQLGPVDAAASSTTSMGFIAGAENRLVATAVNRLMDRALTPAAFKLLALFGPSGTGKTHLANGLVRHWNQTRGPETALYLTAVDFYRQLIDSMKRDSVFEFRRALRGYQLLAIDDMHQLPDENYVSQEFRYTLDAYEENGGAIIVTSPRPAHTLPNIGPDVGSRLAAGLLLQLAPPGNLARIRIIRQAAESLGRQLSDEAASRLAGGVPGTANDLFGAVLKFCATTSNPTDSDTADTDQLVTARLARRPKLREILAVVARYYRLPQSDLKSASRRRSIVFARAIAIFLTRQLTELSYEQIGRGLGGRDHTTIIHNYRKIERTRTADPVVQEAIDELTRILMSR